MQRLRRYDRAQDGLEVKGMSMWGWSVGLGLFGGFAVIKITTLELRGPEWARLVAEGIMWLAWAALVWWAAKSADRRRARRLAAQFGQGDEGAPQ